MLYRLPCISDEKMLLEYVREHHDHGETSISASLGLSSSDYSEWVKKIQKKLRPVMMPGENRCCIFALIRTVWSVC